MIPDLLHDEEFNKSAILLVKSLNDGKRMSIMVIGQ